MRKLGFLLVVLFGVGSITMLASGVAGGEAKTGVATGRAVACTGPVTISIANLSVYRGALSFAGPQFPPVRRFTSFSRRAPTSSQIKVVRDDT